MEVKEPQTPSSPYLGTIRQKKGLKKVVKKFPKEKVVKQEPTKKRSFRRTKYRIDIISYQEKPNIVSILYQMKKKTYRSRVDPTKKVEADNIKSKALECVSSKPLFIVVKLYRCLFQDDGDLLLNSLFFAG